MDTERLQKILAAAGYGSRRSCEALIEAGRVKVDGQVAKLGDQADPFVQRSMKCRFMFPNRASTRDAQQAAGVITSTDDPHGRKTVMDLSPAQAETAAIRHGCIRWGVLTGIVKACSR